MLPLAERTRGLAEQGLPEEGADRSAEEGVVSKAMREAIDRDKADWLVESEAEGNDVQERAVQEVDRRGVDQPLEIEIPEEERSTVGTRLQESGRQTRMRERLGRGSPPCINAWVQDGSVVVLGVAWTATGPETARIQDIRRGRRAFAVIAGATCKLHARSPKSDGPSSIDGMPAASAEMTRTSTGLALVVNEDGTPPLPATTFLKSPEGEPELLDACCRIAAHEEV